MCQILGRICRGRPAHVKVCGRIALGILTLVLLAGPASASASVTIGAERIVITTPGAGAIVDRNPFKVVYTGAGGEAVLSQTENVSGSTLPLTRSAIQPASEPTGPTSYSPLSFLVGSDQPETYTTGRYAGHITGEYSGDLASATETGTEYSARDVIAAEQSGEGVKMTLSTNDPSGRELLVTLTPQSTSGGTAMRLSAVPTDPLGVAAMSDSFDSTPAEAFHGFGGRHDALDQHGQEFYNWVDQENVTTTPEQAGDTQLYPDGPQAAYYVQSSFVSSNGYGFFLNSNSLSLWNLDAGRPEAWQVQTAQPSIEYVVATGPVSQAISELTSITGRQPAPQQWMLGPLFDREVEEPVETAAKYEQQVESDIQNIVHYKLPVEAYRIEGWGLLSTSSLESEIAKLRGLGIRPLLYFRPFVGQELIGTELPGEYEAAVRDGYVATNAEGEPYIFTDNFGADAALIDFTNPAAVAWWKTRVDAALELGAEGFMLDFGEQVLTEMHFSDGSTGAQMHNRYAVLFQRLTREIVEQFEAGHPGRKILFFTRSGYSGEPGSAPFTNFNFPGDETTDWTHAGGLAAQAPDMLNRAIGGAYGFGTDIGGYLDFYNDIEGKETPVVKQTTQELFLRWAEFAALSPVFRLHGAIVGEHTPWSFSKATAVAYRKLSRLHVRAEGLIEELWQEADRTGIPVTRPLYLEYPQDPQASRQEQEWMLGPHVLVAPIYEQGATSRVVYFPQGCWRDPATGEEVVGPTAASVPAALEQLPFFFQCGTEPFKPPAPFRKGK